MRSLGRLAALAVCGAVGVGYGLGTADAHAADAITGHVTVNPLTATLSLPAASVEQGVSFQALGTVANTGAAAISDLTLELRGAGSLIIDAPSRSLANLAGHTAHDETWSMCGAQPGSHLLLLAADSSGPGQGLSAESQAVLVEVVPGDGVCGGFGFDGFFSPVENPPVLNVARAGSSIPVRFSLGGDQGLDIFDPGYPGSVPIGCDSAAPLDVVEETANAGSSGLSYDAASGLYTYVWKTKKPWAGTCRQLLVRLTDGSLHRANFKFRT